MTDYLDQYLTTGGIDDELVTLRNAKFTTDLAYRDGQEPFLSVDIVPDNPDVTELTEQRIGLGTGWEAADDEASVTRADGKKPAFNTSSKVGRLLGSLGKIDSFRSAAKTRFDAGDMPAPLEARFWEGMRGVIKRNEETFTTREGTEASFTYYTFDTFDGWEGEKKAPAKKAASKKAAAKKSAAKKPEPEVEEPAEEPAEVQEQAPAGAGIDAFKAQLVAHCKDTTADDHASWVIEAYETFGDELVSGGDDFQALVDDEGAVWAEVWS